ncbi:helix-turn-helix domain-containing protein [Aquabacterium sp.]|uniref:helix-turn-helix domain-containing protein n=1 Tax=Aquabacterium sp. TaxID=1872578 RepID=UPI002C31BEED|nr:helix-turn-helix domain-containing protein [Aquabacterium sp.]HSW04561.1 helix-turn-helix domain-containing protein [Aquabacterium sp.]
MSSHNVNDRIARRVHALRTAQNLSLDALATRCGVSRSMISLVERGESSPTAVVLERLATGLGVMLASLFDEAPEQAEPVVRRAAQLNWTDPQSGYVRRNLSPPGYPAPLQLVEVSFPPGARVAYETGARERPVHQQLWVIEGAVDIQLGNQQHQLATGDCLAMRLDQPIVFSNPHRHPARYLVAITDDTSAPSTTRRSTP